MRQRLILSFIVLLFSGSAGSLGATVPSSLRSLVGLRAVRVVIEDLNPAMQKTGLRKEQLQAIAEQQLSKNGVTVLRPRDPGKVPILYVRLSSVIGGESTQAPISFYLVVQVKQFAVLTQGPDAPPGTAGTSVTDPLLVTTWEGGTMVMLDRAQLSFYVQHTLTNLLGDLVRDRQEANGKNEELKIKNEE